MADELQKLAELLKVGLLSEAEFAEQKKKLLGQGHQADR
ncbi:SHOCT domain-containing protein [Cupriavidus necator]